MTLTDQLLAARQEYLNMLRSDLLGPGSEFSLPDAEHEVLSGSPVDRYSTGILFPQGNKVDLENDEATINREDIEEDNEKEEAPDDRLMIEEQKTATDERNAPVANMKKEDFNDSIDEDINMSAQYMPSSMGMMFLAEGDLNSIRIKLEFALYEPVKLCEDCRLKYNPRSNNFIMPGIFGKYIDYDVETGIMSLKLPLHKKDVMELLATAAIPKEEEFRFKQAVYRLAKMYESGYQRKPFIYEDYIITFDENGLFESSRADFDQVPIKISALKKAIEKGKNSVTVMLVNTAEGNPEPEQCVFQPRITIDTNNNSFVFVESIVEGAGTGDLSDEDQNLALLYHNKRNYGSGLGVSVDWQIDVDGKGTLWTEFIPVEEVPTTDFYLGENDLIKNEDLSMKYFSDLNEITRDEKIQKLANLVELYSRWINDLRNMVSKLQDRFHKAALTNIEKCELARDRMLKGIELLREDDNAYNAFQLANRAMFMQRVHSEKKNKFAETEDCLPTNARIGKAIREINYYECPDDDCIWRPFQLAFLLMDVESITDDDSRNREIVDLIWFPTGGGKTEAYLGLTAFTIFYRRLAHFEQSGGTAVMMRYTLRLLTAQQFERASTLICACESIRRDCESGRSRYPRYHIGSEEITIGLWIGREHVPNDNSTAKEYIDRLNKAGQYLDDAKERYCKFQVLNCPWCGTKMTKEYIDKKVVGEWGYGMRNGHFYMFCPNCDCDFARALPIQIIDEELYKKPPTLLFATVDKFAMMTWKEETGKFFATSTDNRSPELIVQDELHLISGSLGTIIGLYEMAIDALCSQKGILPKIVASTATIRRADEQCSNLYNRDVLQFPASGLDADDSFFSKTKKINYEKGDFGRLYVGLIPSGKTRAKMEVRVMASLLQRMFMMDIPDNIKDKYWTFTSYFNSLRDLGKASALIGDNLKRDVKSLATRLMSYERLFGQADELTSRVSTSRLNNTLNRLEKVTYKTPVEGEKNVYPVSILLATNMISVGIDVDRLNLLMMVGQPKTTSEYIQATSRVGRKYPGIVINQYDTTRSRDRSHYEHFKSYHESFYRYVEPTSVTPFSVSAMDRALHAALVSLFRQQRTGISGEKDAAGFDKNEYAEVIERIKECYLDRIKGINNRNKNGVLINLDEVSKRIDEFFDYWDLRAAVCRRENKPLRYGSGALNPNSALNDNEYLLKPFESSDRILARMTLTSMRNVDKAVGGYIITRREDV